MKKINKRLFSAMFATLLMGLTACNGVKNVDPQPNDGGEYIVEKPSIAVRKLSSGTDNNSHNYVTFSYTITPANASDRSLITTLTWVTHNGWEDPDYYDANISDYITASVNETSQTITVTCMQAFQNQANLNITCAANSQCTANIPIDYEVRLDGFNFYELKQTSSYTMDGQTLQPWWAGTAESISITNYPSEIGATCSYWDYGNIASTTKMFNFPFNQYIGRAATYSYGSVDNTHETLTTTYSLDPCSLTAFGSVSTNWPNKVKGFFDNNVLPGVVQNGFMTLASFDSAASAWAAQNLTAAETSDLHNNQFTLSFGVDVTYTGSNGVSSTIGISFSYSISGRFFDVALGSFAVEPGVEIIF